MNCFSNRTLLIITAMLSLQLGCNLSLSNKPNLRASDYFDDSQVIALCHAIEANDLDRVKRLVQEGVDVNAKGRGNATPLLWAFLSKQLATFKLLLEHGADPNVIIEDELGIRQLFPGDSVMTLAAKANLDGYLGAVLDHGGDPNLKSGQFGLPALHLVISSVGNKRKRIELLLDHGADINQLSNLDSTPIMRAVGFGGQFGLALFLLEHGADPSVREKRLLRNFVEILVHVESVSRESWNDGQRDDFGKLVDWLADNGWDIDKARRDHKRWGDWIRKHKPTVAKETLGYHERASRIAAEHGLYQ